MSEGLYIHIPFCNGKCPYCDFYSLAPTQELLDKYTDKLCSILDTYGALTFDTVYFGGGTPSLMMPERIGRILNVINIDKDAEITVECNPSDTGSPDSRFDFEKLAVSGVNRISLGLQSSDDTQRRLLGRRGSASDAERAVRRAQKAGIDNISLDLMLGIPLQTVKTLSDSFDFCVSLGAKHISAYMLKIEPDTPYFTMSSSLSLPDEDEVCDLYLHCCELAEKNSMHQYEISNFSYEGFESRHNLKYWHCEEYLGLGPAAHSFLNGRRFFYKRSLTDFLNSASPEDDGSGGDFEEYAMLALRLSEGLIFSKACERFGKVPEEQLIKKAQALEKQGLVRTHSDGISLTRKGFLLSNTVISKLLLE